MTIDSNIFPLPVCKACKNTGRKAVKRKTLNISVVDYIVCPVCKDYEAFYKTNEKMINKEDGVLITGLFD
jgi:hypothetical protein